VFFGKRQKLLARRLYPALDHLFFEQNMLRPFESCSVFINRRFLLKIKFAFFSLRLSSPITPVFEKRLRILFILHAQVVPFSLAFCRIPRRPTHVMSCSSILGNFFRAKLERSIIFQVCCISSVA